MFEIDSNVEAASIQVCTCSSKAPLFSAQNTFTDLN